MIRPMLVLLTAAAIENRPTQHNTTTTQPSSLMTSSSNTASSSTSDDLEKFSLINESQYEIAMIAEMIHTASLLQDDIIDQSHLRRNLPAGHELFGQQNTVLTADYIIIKASQIIAQIGNPQVVKVVSTVLTDLVIGELMQLEDVKPSSTSSSSSSTHTSLATPGSKTTNAATGAGEEANLGGRHGESDYFAHYFKRTYRKTASLLANCCRAVAMLCSDQSTKNNDIKNISRNEEAAELARIAFELGRNVGMSFQLRDDVLDFESSSEALGKPAAASDLSRGLLTGPVLFAIEQFPHPMWSLIGRRFGRAGDLPELFRLIEAADGIAQTKILADMYFDRALENVAHLSRIVLQRRRDEDGEVIFNSTELNSVHRTALTQFLQSLNARSF